jgi:hypothetical protein
MSQATLERDQALEDAEDYYRTHPGCTYREVAELYGLKNHVTLMNRVRGKHGSVADTGGYNRMLTPAQVEVIRAYSRSQAYAGFPCDRQLVAAAVQHIRNQGRDSELEPLPEPSKTWTKNFMKAYKDFHIIKWKPMDRKRRAAQDTGSVLA